MIERPDSAYWEMADYVNLLRERQNIKADELCMGLCSESMLLYFEQRKKELSLGVCHRLLERLGIGSDYFQTYLSTEMYACWQCKERIIYGFVRHKYAEVEEQLAIFEKNYKDLHLLEMQFFLRMRAMLTVCQKGEEASILSDLEGSLRCTVPELSSEYLKGKPLSIKEVDTLIEYYNYLPRDGGKRLNEVLSYIRDRKFDLKGKCKVFPKAVVYLARKKEGKNSIKEWSEKELHDMEALLFEALEYLRDYIYMGYLWEILDLRGKVLTELCVRNAGYVLLEDKKAENHRWLTAVEWMYEQIGESKETTETAIIYSMQNVECTNETIRNRRLMLGLTGKELADGICDEKTIRRVENKKTNPRKSVAVDLFERLHLPRTFFKGDYVGTTPQVKQKMLNVSRTVNRAEYGKAKSMLDELEPYIPMDIEYNRRYFEAEICLLQYKLGEIDLCELEERMRKVIEVSVPMDILWRETKAKYFEWDEIEFYVKYLFAIPNNQEKSEMIMEGIEAYYRNCIGTEQEINKAMYIVYAWQNFQSYYGNRGNFEKSNQMCKELLEVAFYDKEPRGIIGALYALWWNKNEQSETTDITPLVPIAALYNLIKDFVREKTKLEKIERYKPT